MLRSLDKVYPSGLMVKQLYQVMCAVDPGYDFDLMKKDVAYLMEKGYVVMVKIGGSGTLADVHKDSLAVVKLTCTGLEVIQSLRHDPALEI